MAIVFNAVAEKKRKGLPASSGDCVAIGERMAALDKIAKKLAVKPLGDFVSVDAADWGLDEEAIQEIGDSAKADWFDSGGGLATVRALIAHLAEKPRAVKDSTQLVAELRDYEAFLVELSKKKVRWRIVALD